jgi:hypothetical protein
VASVPRELEAPPPRDLAAGKDLYASSNVALIGAAIATFVVLPAIVFGNLFRREETFDALEASMLFGYAWTLVASIVLVVVLLRWLRVRALYRDGVLTEAFIEAVRFEPSGAAEKRATMDLRYAVGGPERRTRVAVVGMIAEDALAQGHTVSILVDPRSPERVAVYTLTTGLLMARSQPPP